MQAPITEEDRPHIEAMISRLNRYRKREAANGAVPGGLKIEYLSDAIKALLEYGAIKDWWDAPD